MGFVGLVNVTSLVPGKEAGKQLRGRHRSQANGDKISPLSLRKPLEKVV